MCNSTSRSSQCSTRPSVWPQTKEMWASKHFHVRLCLFCEIRLAFNRCYFSPVRFSLWPVWPEMNWLLLHVIDIVWLSRVTAACNLAIGCNQMAWRIPTPHYETWETATGNLMSPRCQHLKRPRGVAERQRGQWINATPCSIPCKICKQHAS